MVKVLVVLILIIFVSTTNSQVSQVWVATYDGPSTSTDRGNAIAADMYGNVYVTGDSRGSGTNSDYATIKYNSSGGIEWVSRYNSANHIDVSYGIAVDAAGNVYVTGYSYSGLVNADYATIKYNSSGVQQWAARYNGPFNGTDIANVIRVDNSGNVYVTGYSTGSDGSQDYLTIKYNSSGAEQWTARYNAGAWTDQAVAIALDSNGNVYVTGYSHSGPAVSADYATIKYSNSGVQQWVARYNGPANLHDQAKQIALDNNGNIYVTGYSSSADTNYDYATIKYNSSGIQQWAVRYNGPDNWDDMATSIVVGSSGNIYVTGGSATVDNPMYYFDYATIKYSSTGEQLWAARYDGPAGTSDLALSIKIDNYENLFLTGYSGGIGSNSDIATVKYDSSGNLQWESRYNGTGNAIDQGTAMEIDNSGNVYVAGTSTNNDFDCITLKYHEEVLPVQLSYFESIVIVNSVSLSWGTAWELNNSGFYVERKNINSENWVSICFVPGNGTKNEEIHYSFADKNLSQGIYKYRLKQVDYNGSYEYHSLSENVIIGAPKAFELGQNYPNPSNPNSRINFRIPEAGIVTLKVYDISGKEVAELVNKNLSSDYYSVDFDGTKIASGVYFYVLKSANYSETKKMILIK
jgi:uncharacterized delta-60 repeat protein